MGYPDLGLFNFVEEEKDKFTNFFEFIISKKNYENDLRSKCKSQTDSLNEQLSNAYKTINKLEKDVNDLTIKNKNLVKEKKDFEIKINRLKESYDKEVSELKTLNNKLTIKNNNLTIEKKNTEEKFSKITEAYQKIISGNKNTKNSKFYRDDRKSKEK